MQFRQDCAASAGILRQAVPMMVEREIPPTPNNYALWYAHIAADNQDLSRELLDAFPNSDSYSDDKSDELFFEHFVKQHLPKSEEAQSAVATLLSQLFNVVSKTANGAHEFGDSVKEAMVTLETSSDREEIQETLTTLLDKTHAVEDLNREFQSELNQAKQEVLSLRQALVNSEKTALIDELTQIGNRRAFDQSLELALADSLTPTSLLLLDLDHFKLCNDTYGHVMGDKVLECVGQLLNKLQSEHVSAARYGGEEFALIVRASASNAAKLAELVRAKIESIRITNAGSEEVLNNVSVSIGLAEYHRNESASELKVRTDEALYEAKEAGRNRVCIAKQADDAKLESV
jgi:diguanylate cyclase